MRALHYVLLIASVCVLTICGSASAWDVLYDGSLMPNDIALGDGSWGAFSGNDFSQSGTDGDVLHILDSSPTATAYFYKHAVPAQSPITVEARVRVSTGDGTVLVAGTSSFSTIVQLYPDRTDVSFSSGTPNTYVTDLTQYHTIRIATTAQGMSSVWLDGIMLTHGITTTGNQGGVQFGSVSPVALNESYWDYVACSADFVPVPEPSSLLALGAGGFGLLGAALRRSRRSRA